MKVQENKKESNANKEELLNDLEKPFTYEEKKEEKKQVIEPLDLEEFDEAPILPQEPEGDDTYDLQKELEAKFDELFGPIDDE